MLKKCRQIILLSLLSFFVFTSVGMTAPDSVNYQGRLVDKTTGAALTGIVSLAFSVFDDATAGTLLWSETQSATLDSNGVFQVVLGSGSTTYGSFDADLFIDDDCWLEIVVAGETMNSRQKFASVPFALQAEEAINASSLEGYGSTAFVRKTEIGVVNSKLVLDNSLTAADLAPNSVGSSEILNGSIFTADLHDGTALAEILDDDGSGSGLDADLLDGYTSSHFMPAATDNWVNTSGDTMTGQLTINNNLHVNNYLYVGTDNASDDDFIYFDNASEYLKWDESSATFYLSDNLSIRSPIQASVSSSETPTAYNRFGNGTTTHTSMMVSGKDLLVSDDLEVNGDLYADLGLWVGTDIATNNDFIYFDSGTTESLQWNDSAAEFQLSDDLRVDGEYRYAAAKTYHYQISALEFISVTDEYGSNPNNYRAELNRGYVVYPTTVANAQAPFHLPIGAHITKVKFYYTDQATNSGFVALTGELVSREKQYIINYSVIAHVSRATTNAGTTSGVTYMQDTVVPSIRTFDDEDYFATIKMELSYRSKYVAFCGCEITYTIDKVAP